MQRLEHAAGVAHVFEGRDRGLDLNSLLLVFEKRIAEYRAQLLAKPNDLEGTVERQLPQDGGFPSVSREAVAVGEAPVERVERAVRRMQLPGGERWVGEQAIDDRVSSGDQSIRTRRDRESGEG